MTNQEPEEPKRDRPAKKCQAKDIGHRSCQCGGEYCGANAFSTNRR